MDERNIQIKNKQTKLVNKMPYGMCIWAAGIAPREITKTLISKIPGQTNRCVLLIYRRPGNFSIKKRMVFWISPNF